MKCFNLTPERLLITEYGFSHQERWQDANIGTANPTFLNLPRDE